MNFSGHFSHKNEEKKSDEKIREKSGGSNKEKSAKKSVLPKAKAGPKLKVFFFRGFLN